MSRPAALRAVVRPTRAAQLLAVAIAALLLTGALVVLLGPARDARDDIDAQRDLVGRQLQVLSAQLELTRAQLAEARRAREVSERALVEARRARGAAEQTRDLTRQALRTAQQTRDLVRDGAADVAVVRTRADRLTAQAQALLSEVRRLQAKVPEAGALVP